MAQSKKIIRLGARGSLLSRLQSNLVARALEAAHPHIQVQLVVITTSGDQIQDRPLHEFGGKGLFTKELELALLRGEIDFAVHSFKDIPVTMPLVDNAELMIAAVPPREDSRDALICLSARNILELPAGARVGTGSLRRQAQVLVLRADLQVLPIRGNIDTRIAKLQRGEFDAIILAMAGVKRAGLFDAAIMTPIETDQLLPAAGQGALALECRRESAETRELLSALHDPATALEVDLEREIVRGLNGDCHSPIGALAASCVNQLRLQAAVGARDGHPPLIRAETNMDQNEDGLLNRATADVLKALKAQGAMTLLDGTTK